jgi:biopolymer transport protein ExbB
MSSLIHRFNEGGVFMWAILAFGIFTGAVIVERFQALYTKMKLAPAGFRQQLLAYLQRGDLRGAEAFVASAGAGTGLGRVVGVGVHLRSTASGEEELQARMDEKLAHEISALDKRTGFLAMFGNVATLLGLLGTINGMIGSFAAVANANPADRATMLSAGISEAMNCTAFGLLVAIPALVAFAVFQNRTDRLVNELTESTSEIYHDLLFLIEADRTASTGKTAPRVNVDGSVTVPSPALTV